MTTLRHAIFTTHRILLAYVPFDAVVPMVSPHLHPGEHIVEVRASVPEDDEVVFVEGRWLK